MSSSKQAYLVIAHRNDTVFRTLIQMLDHPKNDIFIHMDAKNKSYNPADTEALVKHSMIFHSPRIKVSRGGYSQIEAELILLDTATSCGNYEHYHLISGQDLPIKPKEHITAFWEEHHGIDFFAAGHDFSNEDRVRYYFPFQEIRGRTNSITVRIMTKLTLILQKILHVRRNKDIKFIKGSNWFSITDELARYILSKREWIRKIFHDTSCGDELFLPTMLEKFPFNSNHENNNMRLIDWTRANHKEGRPYTFRMSDLEEIQRSPALFARKFDEAVDIEIVRKIQELFSV